jgi:hypothetical protein
MKPHLIEKRTVTREYDFQGTDAIIYHPKLGRLLIKDAFGGMGQLRGGAVRWEHGMAIQLKPDDSFESLRDLLGMVLAGYDPERPVLEWDGRAVESLAKSLSLA